MSKILNLYSLPNVAENNAYNFSSQLSYDNPIREDILRLDYQINASNRFFGRSIHNMTEFESPMQNWNLTCMGRLQFPGGCIARAPSWNLALNLVTTISPTLVNEATLGPSVTRSDWKGNNGNISRATNNIGLPLLFPSRPMQISRTSGSPGTTTSITPGRISGQTRGFRPIRRSTSATTSRRS